MSNKVCQICGQEKAADAFSKSYPNRCRDCVAEQARARRQQKAKVNGKKAPVVITDDPIYSPLPYISQEPPQTPDWEGRHYKIALALFFKLLASDASNAGIAARRAKDAADKFINILQDNNQ